MDEHVNRVIGTVTNMTRDNAGVVIEPLDSEDGVLRIRYYEGTNEECPECVPAPDMVRTMMKTSLGIYAPHVTEVELL